MLRRFCAPAPSPAKKEPTALRSGPPPPLLPPPLELPEELLLTRRGVARLRCLVPTAGACQQGFRRAAKAEASHRPGCMAAICVGRAGFGLGSRQKPNESKNQGGGEALGHEPHAPRHFLAPAR
jgi:hypothetical protein